MNIKLTISILLSDRLNTIEKCLNSIVPLLQQVPCELILTITGKDPKVRKLAEQYTDHIIDYKWIDDFADARNQGLKVAKGEWFLFIDDDDTGKSLETANRLGILGRRVKPNDSQDVLTLIKEYKIEI